jgi:hypothetical protein
MRIKPDPRLADPALEIADWILGFQQDKSGAFLNDHESDTPGYTSALYLEGIGAAACLARLTMHRHREYLESCRRGFQFLDGLIIQSRDTSLLPNPAMAIGGLRKSTRSSEVCRLHRSDCLATNSKTGATNGIFRRDPSALRRRHP